jgi:ABC-2 type transport system permease protein
MGRVLAIKFSLALAIMLAISLSLMTVSATMLKMPWGVQATGLLIAAAMSAALCGLATGLGAVFLNLEQRNPMAIVSGFGGTLNLALSLAYMIAVILPFGLLYHGHIMGYVSDSVLRRGWLLAAGWLLLITAVTTLTPLAVGRKSLLTREY